VLAFTAGGDGVRSDPLLCRTEEDGMYIHYSRNRKIGLELIMLIAVPSAPANIKAAASAPNKILVAWLPPAEPNGVLVGYTLYISEEGKDGVRKKVLNSGTESHELVREYAPMKFWLTASTTVGEGESTRVVLVIPTTKGMRAP